MRVGERLPSALTDVRDASTLGERTGAGFIGVRNGAVTTQCGTAARFAGIRCGATWREAPPLGFVRPPTWGMTHLGIESEAIKRLRARPLPRKVNRADLGLRPKRRNQRTLASPGHCRSSVSSPPCRRATADAGLEPRPEPGCDRLCSSRTKRSDHARPICLGDAGTAVTHTKQHAARPLFAGSATSDLGALDQLPVSVGKARHI